MHSNTRAGMIDAPVPPEEGEEEDGEEDDDIGGIGDIIVLSLLLLLLSSAGCFSGAVVALFSRSTFCLGFVYE